MHESSLLRMNWFVQNYLMERKCPVEVLDVGSYDVNGTYKSLFSENVFSYAGLDMEAGPNVDIVPQHPYIWNELEDEIFDVVISGQAFEHIEFPWLTMSEIARVLKKNGLYALLSPGCRLDTAILSIPTGMMLMELWLSPGMSAWSLYMPL